MCRKFKILIMTLAVLMSLTFTSCSKTPKAADSNAKTAENVSNETAENENDIQKNDTQSENQEPSSDVINDTSNNQQSDSPSQTDNDEKTENQQNASENQNNVEPEITINHADAILAELKEYDEFEVDEAKSSEYEVKVILQTNTNIKDFKVVKIDSNKTGLFISKELYKLDEFTPKKPLVLGVVFPGSIPQYGISYTKDNGEIVNLTIDISGEDGSISLNELPQF